MTATLVKLAFAGIRSRLLASALTILLSGAAAATIVLALEVRATARDPWQRTFDAANGAHVLAFVPSRGRRARTRAAPGVAERDAPVPIVRATVGPRGSTDRRAARRPESPPRRNTPVLTAGSPLRDGGIVLERSFADALGLEVGDHAPARRADAARSSSRYSGRRSHPASRATRAATRAWPGSPAPRSSGSSPIAPAGAGPRRSGSTTRPRRRRSPQRAATASRGGRAVRTSPSRPGKPSATDALGDAQGTQVIVTTYTIVLLIVVFAVVAILVGARASEQHREIGLLKAAGLTPRQVGAVFALESAALGLIAVAIGFALGALLAPRLAAPSAETLLGSPTIAANPWHLLVAGCAVLLVLVARALTATRRSTRFSVLQAIRAGAASPPDSRLARAVARSVLPLTLALGLKDLLARRHRALRLAAAIAVTGAAIVFALSMDATLDAQPAGEASDVPDELLLLVYSLDAVLLLITVDDARRGRPALGARAHPRLRRAQGDRPHAHGRSPRASSAPTPPWRWSPRSSPIPLGIGPLPRPLPDRRRHDRGRRPRAVVVARAGPDRNRARRRSPQPASRPGSPPESPPPTRSATSRRKLRVASIRPSPFCVGLSMDTVFRQVRSLRGLAR